MDHEKFCRSLTEAIQKTLEERSLRQDDLAREPGISRSYLSRIVNGHRDPNFSVAITWLNKMGYEVRIYPAKGKDGSVKRRAFLTAAASAAFIPSSAAGPYQDAAYVRALADDLAHTRDEVGGVPIVPTALRHVRHIAPAITGKDRRLQAAASELARWSALVLYDAQRPDAAERIAGLSLALARASADVDAQARAYKTLSHINTDRGQGDRAAMFARQGLRLCGISDDERAILHIRLARALAIIPGQASAARAALDHAQNIEGLSPFYALDIPGNAGIVLNAIGAHEKSDACFEQALRMIEDLENPAPLLYANYLAQQTIAALRRAEPEPAAERMHVLARMFPLVTSARLDRQIKEILTASAPWARVPEMRDARDRLRTLTQA